VTAERVLPTQPGDHWWVTRSAHLENAEVLYVFMSGCLCVDADETTYAVDDPRWTWIEPVLTPAEVAALRAQVAELQAQLDEIAPHLDAGRLFSAADGAEVPTTLVERAKWMAAALDAEGLARPLRKEVKE
jgi:hypothetical protein